MSSKAKSKKYLSSDSEDSDEPKQKKTKKPTKKDSEDEEFEADPKDKKVKPKKDEDGKFMFELGQMKYATVSEFKGKVYVGVREYYFKDQNLMPGKKGIALNMDQWRMFKNNIDDIDQALKEY